MAGINLAETLVAPISLAEQLGLDTTEGAMTHTFA